MVPQSWLLGNLGVHKLQGDAVGAWNPPSGTQHLTLLVGKHPPSFLPRGLTVLGGKGLLAVWPLHSIDGCEIHGPDGAGVRRDIPGVRLKGMSILRAWLRLCADSSHGLIY